MFVRATLMRDYDQTARQRVNAALHRAAAEIQEACLNECWVIEVLRAAVVESPVRHVKGAVTIECATAAEASRARQLVAPCLDDGWSLT